jgi:hypothetical protein
MATHNHAMSQRAPQLEYRVIVFRGFRPIGQRFILNSWLAITIERWIFAWRPLNDAELAHELTHVKQWKEHGFLGYIAAYMSESRRASRAGGDRYRDNRFEVEARAAEDAVRHRASAD